MYGMVNRAIEEMVVTSHGEETWERIKLKAGVDVDVFVSSEGYPDAVTYSLVGAASEVLDTPAEKILESFGVYWVVETAQRGYGDMMASGGKTLREFLVNLPDFHSRLSMIFPHLAPPLFHCSASTERSVTLQYRSGRPGLAPFVVGLLKGLGQVYSTPATVTQVAEKTDNGDFDEFVVAW